MNSRLIRPPSGPRDWMVIPAAILIALGLASIYLAMAPRTYVATSSVFVSMRSADTATIYLRGTFSFVRAQSYTALATNPELLQSAIDEVAPAYPLERLAGEVTASVIPQTILLQVSVSGEDPRLAGRFSEAIAEKVSDRGSALEQAGSDNDAPISLTPLGDVYVSPTPLAPSALRVLTLALLIGVVIGSGALSALRSRVALQGASAPSGSLAGLDVLARVERHSMSRLGGTARRDQRVLEQLRILRTGLVLGPSRTPRSTLLVASPATRDGRSSTALGLALVLAEGRERVLLIDGDLRNRGLSAHLAVGRRPGVSDLVHGEVALEECIVTDDRGFDFLGGGSDVPNPADLLSSHKLSELVADLESRYDRIVIDTPAARDVADATLWAATGSSSVVISRYARTREAQVAATATSLARAGARPVGVVITAVR